MSRAFQTLDNLTHIQLHYMINQKIIVNKLSLKI